MAKKQQRWKNLETWSGLYYKPPGTSFRVSCIVLHITGVPQRFIITVQLNKHKTNGKIERLKES